MKLNIIGLVAVSALLVAAPLSKARAADMSVAPSAAPEAPPPPGWTGFYLGVNVGGVSGWDNVSPTVADGGTFPRTNRMSLSGIFGGGTLGYNYQFGSFVLGVEGDVGGMNLARGLADPLGGTEIDFINSGFYADATGRLGFLALTNFLVYGKGGYAFYDANAHTSTGLPGFTVGNSGTFNGWTAGGGAEYRFNSAWSIKAEYLYFNFGSERATLTSAAGVFGYTNTLRANTIKFGVNYLF
jgi:outer membrane immunogenic protein